MFRLELQKRDLQPQSFSCLAIAETVTFTTESLARLDIKSTYPLQAGRTIVYLSSLLKADQAYRLS
jgi:hypothetical protein